MSFTPPDPNIEKGYSPEAAQAQTQAQLDAEAARQAALTPALDTSDAGLKTRGVGLATELTSPGGPWHGLAPEAASDPNNADWAENQRWAIVEGGQNGSFLVVTHDGTTRIGDHAENVRGYAHPSKAAQANLRNRDDKLTYATEIGNGLAYGGADPGFYVAEFADQE